MVDTVQAKALKQLKKYEHAIRVYDILLMNDPEDVDVLNLKGNIYFDYLDRYEVTAHALVNLYSNGCCSDSRMRCGATTRPLKSTLARVTSNTTRDLLFNIWSTMKKQLNGMRATQVALAHITFPNSFQRFDNALMLDPTKKSCYYGKAACYKALRQYEEVIKCYDSALELDPNDVELLNLKGK
jgi:tetratricopeptide (TPR) repeat protein